MKKDKEKTRKGVGGTLAATLGAGVLGIRAIERKRLAGKIKGLRAEKAVGRATGFANKSSNVMDAVRKAHKNLRTPKLLRTIKLLVKKKLGK